MGTKGRFAPDMAGLRFGRIVVIERAGLTASRHMRWLVRCDCGVEKVVGATALRRGQKSCGCIVRTHGLSRSRTYKSWQLMRQRCTNPKFGSYAYCGAKGITVCARWERFENFVADMGERPNWMSIDRINPFGNYEPANCRWATRQQQDANTRRNTEMGDCSQLDTCDAIGAFLPQQPDGFALLGLALLLGGLAIVLLCCGWSLVVIERGRGLVEDQVSASSSGPVVTTVTPAMLFAEPISVNHEPSEPHLQGRGAFQVDGPSSSIDLVVRDAEHHRAETEEAIRDQKGGRDFNVAARRYLRGGRALIIAKFNADDASQYICRRSSLVANLDTKPESFRLSRAQNAFSLERLEVRHRDVGAFNFPSCIQRGAVSAVLEDANSDQSASAENEKSGEGEIERIEYRGATAIGLFVCGLFFCLRNRKEPDYSGRLIGTEYLGLGVLAAGLIVWWTVLL